ncbi:agamous-like MADS-box protein AGL12 [Mangifera indica]|uniref:agamous-like MADS-box protein AGL12 n=1 Tax=Mangifera indica TaxID=29780 RepID=UPI001CFB745B|nr:agamous-like MADS-box protein AGL12 [Mangifera indica]
MARGKVQMRRIENPMHRQVTFCKRRAGLLKKAKELSLLCDAEIGVLIFSANGKIYEMATKGTMQGLIERYMNANPVAQTEQAVPQGANEEINMLKQEIEVLKKGLSYMFGGGAVKMTLNELLMLEKHLEIWIYQIRSAKMDTMFQEINLLRNKEGILKATNKFLQDKIEENIRNIAGFGQMTSTIDYPLIIPNEIFHF